MNQALVPRDGISRTKLEAGDRGSPPATVLAVPRLSQNLQSPGAVHLAVFISAKLT